MSWITLNPLASLSYGFLYFSVFLLWVSGDRKIPAWSLAFFISIILGLMSHQLEMIAIIPMMVLAIAAYYNQAKKIIVRVASALVVLILGFALTAHQLPGFHHLEVIDHVYISRDAVPFTLSLTFDKTIVGLFILGFCVSRISQKNEWVLLLKQLVLKIPAVIAIIIVLALILNYVKFDFKIPNTIFIWSITNLLFVCMAEEAFFRGFIQKNLALIMKKIKYGDYLALLIAAIVFGLTHYYAGVKYVILSTVAGAGYGWVYLKTKRIEGSIMTHFSLNLTHILFFTYPALASVV